MKVMVAMSGGVDSSVAAALLAAAVTTSSASRCGCGAARATPGAAASPTSTTPAGSPSSSTSTTSCSTSATTSTRTSSSPYVAAHAAGTHAEPVHRVQPPGEVRPPRRAGRACSASTPSPPATTPAIGRRRRPLHARAGRRSGQGPELRRAHARPGRPRPHAVPGRRADTRPRCAALAAALGLRTAAKPDSQDVCFITSTGGRRQFLGRRIPFTPGRVVDTGGAPARRRRRRRAGHGRSAPGARPAGWRTEAVRRRRRPATATVVVGDEPTSCSTADLP